MSKKSNAWRDDNRIKVQVYLGRDPQTKKRKYKYVYGKTQKEADAKADDIRLALKKGIDITPELVTFSQWADRWHTLKKPEVAAARAVVYASHIKHLKAAFGSVDITKIRTADIQNVILSLSEKNPNTGKPMTRETLVGLKSTVNQIFQLAIDNRVMDYNPVTSVRITARKTPSAVRALTETEQQWIIDTPHDRAQLAAMIMMYSGLRRGELMALKWSDINLSDRKITVNKAIEMVEGKPALKDYAKTPESIRAVNVPARLISYLKEQKRESIYVCVSASRKMHTESSWKRMWSSYLADLNLKYGDFSPFERKDKREKKGKKYESKEGTQYKSKFDPVGVPFVIPRINPHWLRHTFCTLLYFAGVDVLTAMKQMGHSDIRTTLEIYTHLDALYKGKDISKLDVYLDGEPEKKVGQKDA